MTNTAIMAVVTLPWPHKEKGRTTCSVDNCGSSAIARGLCNAHYKRLRRHGSPTGGYPAKAEQLAFLREAARSQDREACIHWPYNRNGRGYPSISINGVASGTHVVMCRMIHGARPTQEHEVAHSCGNGHLGCINPHHLRWATRRDNHKDKVLHGTTNRGSRCAASKLTERDVREIRAMRGRASLGELAERFGVSKPTICNIHKGKTWGWMQ